MKWKLRGMITLVFATAAAAQTEDQLKVVQIRSGMYVLLSDIGNVGVLAGPDGVLLVDDQYSRTTAQIQAAVAQITKAPIRLVINTHWHRDHSGGNENMNKAGAVVVAHENVRVRMGSEQFMKGYNVRIAAATEAALPLVTFSDTATFHLNGDVIRTIHVPNAHTDGDAIVHFAKANVLHMGDVFFNGIFPFIDISSGGNAEDLICAVETALALADADTRIIPAHGPVTDKTGLAAYHAMLRDVVAKVAEGIRAGRGLETIQAQKPAAAYQARYEGDADRFVGFIYESLVAKRDGGRGMAGHCPGRSSVLYSSGRGDPAMAINGVVE